MKYIKPLGLLASAFLLSFSALSVGAADQYQAGTDPGNRTAGDAGMQRDDMPMQQTQKRERRTRASREAGLVECKDSPKCRQKNTNWPDLQETTKPLLVDPATGMPPKK